MNDNKDRVWDLIELLESRGWPSKGIHAHACRITGVCQHCYKGGGYPYCETCVPYAQADTRLDKV
jgi:hypothetical protein